MGLEQPSHWLFIILVLVVLFGAKRLPDSAKSIAKSLKMQKPDEWSYWAWCFDPGKWMAVCAPLLSRASRAVNVPPTKMDARVARSGRLPDH